MGRALYDARPMQTPKLPTLLLALMAASTLATAQDAAPAANPAAAGPSFAVSDEIPSSAGYGDAYSLDEIKLGGAALTEEQQVERWQAELGAGRARAGAMLGAYLSYRALTRQRLRCRARRARSRPTNSASDQAAWLLAQLGAQRHLRRDDRSRQP